MDYNLLKVEFGAYILVFFKDNNPTNTTKSRNTGAIAFMGNSEGDYHFISLTTG